jgi:hypothetical protein
MARKCNCFLWDSLFVLIYQNHPILVSYAYVNIAEKEKDKKQEIVFTSATRSVNSTLPLSWFFGIIVIWGAVVLVIRVEFIMSVKCYWNEKVVLKNYNFTLITWGTIFPVMANAYSFIASSKTCTSGTALSCVFEIKLKTKKVN